MKNHPLLTRRNTVLTSVSAIAIVATALFIPASIETKFDRKRANEVVNLIRSNALIPNSQGLVTLPPKYQSISCNGKVYVSKGDKGEMIIFIPSRIGRQQLILSPVNDDLWVQGYLFTDTLCRTPENLCSWIVNAPAYTEPWNARNNSDVQTLSLLNGGSEIDAHWYKVDIMS